MAVLSCKLFVKSAKLNPITFKFLPIMHLNNAQKAIHFAQ